MNLPLVSFIIPVYQEEKNIARMLSNLYAVISGASQWKSEVIIIEDGSRDHTRQVIEEEIKKYPTARLILHEKNQGYTQSLKDGIGASKGQFLMYVGADEEFEVKELPQFIEPLITDKADIVLGVRWQRNAYKLFRFFLSVIYIFFLNYLFKMRVNDYNWSQAWRKEVLDDTSPTSTSLFVLPEIIIKASDMNYRILEVPSNHRGRQWGKSSLNMGIMAKALWEALTFWGYRRSKRYRALRRTPDKNQSSQKPIFESTT